MTPDDTLAALRTSLVLIANECVQPTDQHTIPRIQSLAHDALANVRVAPSPETPRFDHDGTWRHHHHYETNEPIWWENVEEFGGEKRHHVHQHRAPSPETPGLRETLDENPVVIRRAQGEAIVHLLDIVARGVALGPTGQSLATNMSAKVAAALASPPAPAGLDVETLRARLTTNLNVYERRIDKGTGTDFDRGKAAAFRVALSMLDPTPAATFSCGHAAQFKEPTDGNR